MSSRFFLSGLFAMALLSSSWSLAESSSSDSFRTAFDACSAKYQRPQPGQEPSDDFKACLKAAGFDGPPAGGPPSGGGRPPGPPPSGSQ